MKKYILIILISICLQSCVEPFEAATQQFENALVVDARLTDEEKQQVILLSRARPFEEDNSSAEQNATVKITDDIGNTYAFRENEPGKYLSEAVFSAQQNRSYQLSIATSNQKLYSSSLEATPEKVTIENLYFERKFNDFGEEGVSVFIDNNSGGDEAKYFKYEYDETYKIIAPDWDPFEFDIIDSIACESPNRGFEVDIKLRTKEARVCYNTVSSTTILQVSTNAFETNKISRFPVRFLSREDFVISHRYSIIVKQHTQNLEAYSYYQNLEAFSSTDNVFSEIQPGFLAGNINAESDKNEKVIGYFEVSSVNSKRVYFNYEDFFQGEALPPYPINCLNAGSPPLRTPGFHCDNTISMCDGSCQSPLIDAIQAGIVVFLSENEDFERYQGPYLTKPAACGDCTKLGSNKVPDFWVE